MAMNNAVPHSHFLSAASPFSVNLITLGASPCVKVQGKVILVVQEALHFSTTQCYGRPPSQHLFASCSPWSHGGRSYFTPAKWAPRCEEEDVGQHYSSFLQSQNAQAIMVCSGEAEWKRGERGKGMI